MITPTVGRKVWFFPAGNDNRMSWDPSQPLDATLVYVHSGRMVNLFILDHQGNAFRETSVTLLQDDDLAPEGGRFAAWMPYQKGQARAQENTEGAQLAKASEDAPKASPLPASSEPPMGRIADAVVSVCDVIKEAIKRDMESH